MGTRQWQGTQRSAEAPVPFEEAFPELTARALNAGKADEVPPLMRQELKRARVALRSAAEAVGLAETARTTRAASLAESHGVPELKLAALLVETDTDDYTLSEERKGEWGRMGWERIEEWKAYALHPGGPGDAMLMPRSRNDDGCHKVLGSCTDGAPPNDMGAERTRTLLDCARDLLAAAGRIKERNGMDALAACTVVADRRPLPELEQTTQRGPEARAPRKQGRGIGD